MNKLTHIESILEHVRDNPGYDDETKSMRYDLVDSSIQSFVAYHNEAVAQGGQITMARIRCQGDFEKFAAFVENLHERRKELHKSMIDHAAILNRLCADEGLEPVYTGALDLEKGRDDTNTRFGVAAFGEELCRDLFRTTDLLGVPARAHEAFKDHAKRVIESGGAWNAMQRMLAQADARRRMDASGPEPGR